MVTRSSRQAIGPAAIGSLTEPSIMNSRMERFAQPVDGITTVFTEKPIIEFAAEEPAKRAPVRLRLFRRQSKAEATECLGTSPATAGRRWVYSRA